MPNQVFITDADLYDRIGGRAALTQLLDATGSGIWNATVSLKARTDACNIVLEAAGVQSDLGGVPAEEFAAKHPNLVTYAALKALALVWIYGTGGQAMPARLAAFDVQAEQALEKLATRRRKHGASDFSPQPAQEIGGALDLDPDRTRMTLRSWMGFGATVGRYR